MLGYLRALLFKNSWYHYVILQRWGSLGEKAGTEEHHAALQKNAQLLQPGALLRTAPLWRDSS